MTIALGSVVVQIGVDASGKFLTGPGYEATVLAAAIGPDRAFAEISRWSEDALRRWGIAERLGELHAKELGTPERLEVCEMLGGRADIRLCAVATDSLLLGSNAALARHRERQYEKALSIEAVTDGGKKRKAEVLAQLDGRRLSDADYAFAVVLPLLAIAALQRAFGYFGGENHRADMRAIEVFVDREAPPTKRYVEGTLLPTISGDERFRLTTPEHWREPPIHPLLDTAMHEDGDGLRAEALLGDLSFANSEERAAIQIADVAAWVIRRALSRPEEAAARKMFDTLKPLLVGEGGNAFELFSIVGEDAEREAMYAHLRRGEQPGWWLMPGGRAAARRSAPPLTVTPGRSGPVAPAAPHRRSG